MANAISRALRALSQLLGQVWAYTAGKYRERARQQRKQAERYEAGIAAKERAAEQARDAVTVATPRDRRDRLRQSWQRRRRDAGGDDAADD